jgi:hypothetical protein
MGQRVRRGMLSPETAPLSFVLMKQIRCSDCTMKIMIDLLSSNINTHITAAFEETQTGGAHSPRIPFCGRLNLDHLSE